MSNYLVGLVLIIVGLLEITFSKTIANALLIGKQKTDFRKSLGRFIVIAQGSVLLWWAVRGILINLNLIK